MANTIQDKSSIEQMFNRISTRYDLANDLQSLFLHRYWKKRVVSLAGVPFGGCALDICCGTGDIAIELAKTGALVVGIDLSMPMLKIATQRLNKLTPSFSIRCCPHFIYMPDKNSKLNCHFIKADALDVPFRDNTFDAITIGYGLRNLVDWKKGLSEMFRVVKPDGRIVILEFGKPPNKIWNKIYFFYLKKVVPYIGKFVANDYQAYFYISESLERYPGQYVIDEALKEFGGFNNKIINILGGAMTINYCQKRA